MRPQPLIAVTDVEESSRWYQRLLGCQSAHGGTEYERLVSNGTLILLTKPDGNGVLLWFESDDFDAAVARAAGMKAEVVLARIVIHLQVAAVRTTGNAGCAILTGTLSCLPVRTVRQDKVTMEDVDELQIDQLPAKVRAIQ